jgi:hypothetical protein
VDHYAGGIIEDPENYQEADELIEREGGHYDLFRAPINAIRPTARAIMINKNVVSTSSPFVNAAAVLVFCDEVVLVRSYGTQVIVAIVSDPSYVFK